MDIAHVVQPTLAVCTGPANGRRRWSRKVVHRLVVGYYCKIVYAGIALSLDSILMFQNDDCPQVERSSYIRHNFFPYKTSQT